MMPEDPQDSPTARRAVYVIEHSEKGGIGVCLNKNFSKSMAEIAESIPSLASLLDKQLMTEKVMAGGPVAGNIPWILSKNLDTFDSQFRNDSLSINFSTAAFNATQAEHYALCGIGTFGWGPGQLEKELSHFFWHYFPTDQATLESLSFPDEFRSASQLLLAMKYE